jgi:hypothetical protein
MADGDLMDGLPPVQDPKATDPADLEFLGTVRFAAGDLVRITDADHPWTGQRGRIVERLDRHRLDWVVELPGQGGHRCGVAEQDMRKDHADGQ